MFHHSFLLPIRSNQQNFHPMISNSVTFLSRAAESSKSPTIQNAQWPVHMPPQSYADGLQNHTQHQLHEATSTLSAMWVFSPTTAGMLPISCNRLSDVMCFCRQSRLETESDVAALRTGDSVEEFLRFKTPQLEAD